ncbi:transmembrane signal receptor [Lithospermum erythrorhizon]|uniref:non-specific serine/threonine protein kinase n=1 Tax=Lithospermum erythrorhizon TaxID=34254 RepID=A0AAV3R319_LITER
MMKLIISLHFSFMLFVPYFLKSDGQSANMLEEYCPEQSCGDIVVKYPFYRTDTSPSARFCGYQGFGVTCPGDPMFYLNSNAFKVENISYENKTLALVDTFVMDNSTCPRLRQNLTIDDGLPLEYSSQNSNLTFYFNCTSSIVGLRVVDCLSMGGNRSYIVQGADPKIIDWYVHCEEKVSTTLIGREIIEGWFNTVNFGRIMNLGFELKWTTSLKCHRCEESNGKCGFNDLRELLCFCNDGTIRSNDCRKGGLNLRLKLIIGFGAGLFGATAMCIVFFLYQRRVKSRRNLSYKGFYGSSSYYPNSLPDMNKAGNYGVHVFDYKEIQRATNDFDSNNALGDGGFGVVYKGKLRDGRDVGIKRLYEHNFKRVEQFMNEIEILTRLHHPNLVILYGCTNHNRELLLVYEYIPNGTVADHLHGERARPGSLSWTTRLNIAIETASALAYLHAVDVIHRDIKTTNILLDDHFRVKVADFGISRLFPTNVTHVSTAPQGTPGYVDPEYHQYYQLTDKSDVYSFGVVLVELISSKPAVDISRHMHEINLSNMAINKIQRNALHELVDPYLGYESDNKVKTMINAVAEIAFRCLQGREMRPSMQEVQDNLQEIRSNEYNAEKHEEIDISADDAILFKNDTPVSPDSGSASSVSGPV